MQQLQAGVKLAKFWQASIFWRNPCLCLTEKALAKTCSDCNRAQVSRFVEICRMYFSNTDIAKKCESTQCTCAVCQIF